jgi:hypothetical protein
MGLNDLSQYVFILDFGLSKKYRSSRTLEQFPFVNRRKITGTARYASIHALEAYEQSRRDDLESVGYVLMYFLRGDLPWQGLKVKSKEDRYKKILEKKKETSSEDLCKNFPHEFYKYVDYTKNLEYTQNPDYDMLKQLFLDVVKGLKEKMDYIYDWTTKEDLQNRKEIKKKENNSEKESNGNKDNKNKKSRDEEIKSNNEQNDRNLPQHTKRDEEKEDKVESVCCNMYVHILYNFHFIYSF